MPVRFSVPVLCLTSPPVPVIEAARLVLLVSATVRVLVPSEIVPPAPDSEPDHFDIFQNYEIEAERRDDLRQHRHLTEQRHQHGVDGPVTRADLGHRRPRPHTSGHWSIDGADCSQFALQVRTLCGLPLVAPRQHSAAVML